MLLFVALFASSGSDKLVALSQKEGSNTQLDCYREEVYVLLNLGGGGRWVAENVEMEMQNGVAGSLHSILD